MTTWTPKAKQAETWTEEFVLLRSRVFDPYVFDNSPIFDTGTPAGVWDAKSRQSEVWMAVS